MACLHFMQVKQIAVKNLSAAFYIGSFMLE